MQFLGMIKTDDDVDILVIDIDSILYNLCRKYSINPLLLSSVILARLVIINRDLHNLEDWNRLLRDCIDSTSIRRLH